MLLTGIYCSQQLPVVTIVELTLWLFLREVYWNIVDWMLEGSGEPYHLLISKRLMLKCNFKQDFDGTQ
jgi:hypothetical protein